MEVANRRCQHDDIARRESTLQDQLPHNNDESPTPSRDRQSIANHEEKPPPESLAGLSSRRGRLITSSI